MNKMNSKIFAKLRSKFKMILAIFWVAFTLTLISWWMVYLSSQTELQVHNHKKMFLWEGSILLIAVGMGGLALIMLTIRDEARFNRLRLFFSTFSHDIKTSITRLRLQADVLEEEMGQNKKIKRLIHDIHRLDLQLENSLWMANLSEVSFYLENISLFDFFSTLKSEFVDLHIEITKDAILRADRRAFGSVVRNILQNSEIHGHASEIKVEVVALDSNKVELKICDNGVGMEVIPPQLGQELLKTKSISSNGIGLFLSRYLITKQNGSIHFKQVPKGFCVLLNMPGVLKDNPLKTSGASK